MSVYLIGAYHDDALEAVKIGHSGNVPGRLATLQTSHHRRLALLATLPGGAGEERILRQRFRGHRLRGEWFRPHPEVLEAALGPVVEDLSFHDWLATLPITDDPEGDFVEDAQGDKHFPRGALNYDPLRRHTGWAIREVTAVVWRRYVALVLSVPRGGRFLRCSDDVIDWREGHF